ncbi:hypothetical protein Lal_00027527 [Lupinus albus]|uniref:Putative phosphoglycerate/bisphosphoglycerate mutase, active, histidine phosphatase superfamily n=1 Tax=Lupinus albus TaxID=3870 RepID=A0A6A4QH38_LUPAL|nr:putative phosphoglycerate/bisphosphoglycerate mutase, active, histidine phosphatase superfamily [Lupinus albus]KAF1873489.1 hypothetical protein Lal_00027527 [Lupinus albus]
MAILHTSKFFWLKTKPNSNTNAPLSIQCCHNQRNPIQLTSNAISGPEKNPIMKIPSRPRRIILVRHGESEGNVDESLYTRVADLTEKGKVQAEECGHRIKNLIEKDKALETLKSLARPFERSRIAGFREEPRIREQDFLVLTNSKSAIFSN